MIEGYRFQKFQIHQDSRGTLFELHRAGVGQVDLLQWNLVKSTPNALRGVHIHLNHDDHLIVIEGAMLLGLHDARPYSPTYGKSELHRLMAKEPGAAIVPRGVLHGFYCAEQTTYVYGLTACWTPADDLGCRWNDPDLGLDWPVVDPLLSERDRHAPELSVLKQKLSSMW